MATTAETNEVKPDVSPAPEPTGDITEAQLVDMLREMDGLKPLSRSASPEPAPKVEAEADSNPLPADGGPSEVESEQKQEAKASSPDVTEAEAKKQSEEPQKGEAAEPAKDSAGDKQESRFTKDQARLADSWKRLEEEKALVRKQAEDLKLAKEKAEEDAIKSVSPDLNTSPEDLRRYAREWENDGRTDIAAEARKMADQIERAQKLKSERDERIARQSEEEKQSVARRLVDDNPELKDKESVLYKAVADIVNSQDPSLRQFFSSNNNGLLYATQIAKIRIAAESAASLMDENTSLKQENEDLRKKLSLGSSTGSKPAKGKKEFEEMDYKEQETFLRKMLSESDSVLAGV